MAQERLTTNGKWVYHITQTYVRTLPNNLIYSNLINAVNPEFPGNFQVQYPSQIIVCFNYHPFLLNAFSRII